MKINQVIFLLLIPYIGILHGIQYDNMEKIYKSVVDVQSLKDVPRDIPLAIVAPYMDKENNYQNVSLFIDAYYFYINCFGKKVSEEEKLSLCVECLFNQKENYIEANLINLWNELKEHINNELLKNQRDFFWRKAQEAVNYYNENNEMPYDDEGYYTVEDFLNDKDEEDTKPVIPMSESGSSSIQNSNETSPQKDAVQERTSVLRSIPMEVE